MELTNLYDEDLKIKDRAILPGDTLYDTVEIKKTSNLDTIDTALPKNEKLGDILIYEPTISNGKLEDTAIYEPVKNTKIRLDDNIY